MDPWLKRAAAAGLALSLLVLLLGAANVPVILALWILYHTLTNVGQHWRVVVVIARVPFALWARPYCGGMGWRLA